MVAKTVLESTSVSDRARIERRRLHVVICEFPERGLEVVGVL